MTPALLILLTVLLITLSAFFSSSEIAYATASKPRLRTLAEEGNRKAIRAQNISEDFNRMIATILVGNNLVNIAATSVVTVLCTEYYLKGRPNAELYAEIASTLLLLIFGEIFPKILAADHASSLVLRFSGPLQGAIRFFNPIVRIVTRMVDKLSVLWAVPEPEPSITDEELVMVVDNMQEEGGFTESEGELIKSAIGFSELTAHDILIPRVDVSAWDIAEPLAGLLSDRDAMSFSRIPVYREDVDHIIGILNTKELMKAVLACGDPALVDVESLLVEPMFVHMTKDISDILKELRETGRNMAVVLDEYGGTMGILTREDIMEEIVGEIYDETDEIETDCSEMGQNTYLLDGDMSIADAFEYLEYDPKDFESEYTTLSGWITEQLDKFPESGDSFVYDRLTVTVMSVDGRLVRQAKIYIEPEKE